MRRALTYCKFFIVCAFSFSYLFSCVSNNVAPKDRKKREIHIIGSNTTTHKLTMIDEDGKPADTLVAYSGQKVKWYIEDGSHVKSIRKIYPKSNSQTIFEDQPDQIIFSKNWGGKLKVTSGELVEDYNIDWRDENNQDHPFDPKIQLNPTAH
jgi:hypothetical protein